MTTRAHRDAAPGELVAIDLPPGEPWLDALADLWWRGVAVLPIDHRLSPTEKRAIVDAAAPSLVIDDDGATAFPDVGVTDPDGSAIVIATSGTGGRPKLAELSRSAIEGAIERSNAAIEVTVDTPWLAVLPPAHVGGLLVYLRHAIFNTPVAAHERFDPAALATGGSVCASLVPAMASQLAEAGDDPLDGVTLVAGGGALDRNVRAALQLRGARVFQTYGMTETCGGVAYEGAPLPDVDVRIAAGDRVEVRSPTLFGGYRRDPQATADAFTVDGWLRTGDLGSLDDDGRLTIFGRADDAIRTGGETVWPDEVERALRDHPKVAEVAVRGVSDARWGEQVAAWVVPRTVDDPPTLEEIREHCAGTLARFKLPKEMSLVAELPRTATGKVRRADLR